MRKLTKLKQIASCFMTMSIMVCGIANAAALPNLTGHYYCTGMDKHDGKYDGTLTLTLDNKNITKDGAGYSFSLSDGSGADASAYNGFAAFDGKSIAIYFANKDTRKNDYGVGVASVMVSNTTPVMKFTKFYYEPKYTSNGNTGIETCTKIVK